MPGLERLLRNLYGSTPQIDLDKKLMEDVVPWVPYLWSNGTFVTGDDVTASDWDQFAGTIAYSKVAVDQSKQQGL